MPNNRSLWSGLKLRALKALIGTFDDPTLGEARVMLRGIFPGATGEPPKRGTKEALQAYNEMPWLRAVVQKVALSMAAPAWRLYARTGKNGKAIRDEEWQTADAVHRAKILKRVSELGELREVTRHPMLDVLRRGNPVLTGLGVRAMTSLYYDVVGEVAWWKVRNGFGAPVSVWPIPPTWILSTPTPEKPLFRLGYRSWQAEVPETDILWWTDPDPLNPYGRGSSRVLAMGDELDTDEFAAKHQRAFFYNRAAPNMIISGEALNDAAAKALEQRWKAKYFGKPENQQLPFMTNKTLTVTEVGQNNKDMETMALREFHRSLVREFYGVPPEIMGIIENSNRATIDAADYLYARHVLVPRLEIQREVLQQKLAPEYDDRLVIDYESPVQEDKAHQLAAMTAAPWAATVDEWRGVAGLPPKEDGSGEVHMVPFGLEARSEIDANDTIDQPETEG